MADHMFKHPRVFKGKKVGKVTKKEYSRAFIKFVTFGAAVFFNFMIFERERLQKTNLVLFRAFSILSLLAVSGACTVAGETNLSGEDLNPTQDFEIIDIGEEDQIAPGDIPTGEPSPCPGLDSMLTQIYQSPEPLIQAQQLQIRTEGDKIQVLLILEGGETSFLEEFSVEISKQSGNQVQAFVPIEQLCALADSERVLVVRTITQIIGD